MKKLFVLFAAVTLFIGVQACKQKEEATEEAATEVSAEPAAAAPADSTAASAEDTSGGKDIKGPVEKQP